MLLTNALGREITQKVGPGNPAFADILADIRRAEGHGQWICFALAVSFRVSFHVSK